MLAVQRGLKVPAERSNYSKRHLELKRKGFCRSIYSLHSERENVYAYAAIKLNDYQKATEDGLLHVARYEILRSIRTFNFVELYPFACTFASAVETLSPAPLPSSDLTAL